MIITAYNVLIITAAILLVYLVCSMDINIISSIAINLFCTIIVHIMESYILFYISLLVLLISSYRYYNKNMKKKDFKSFPFIAAMYIINILLSVCTLVRVFKYHSQIGIPTIELIPIVYISVVYAVVILFSLSFYNYLSIVGRQSVRTTITKIILAVITMVLLIIFVNAVLYYMIHNYPSSLYYGIFDGNFLKDPISYYYRSSKAFSDCLWFSATTFFTVGYGDMHPVGNIMYLLTMMEMVSAYILGIIIVPIVLFKASDN
ncbi:ion channel [Clostridium thermarum]|uniref:ion channel n=1 Tax=Clostridium thermarum TaxID=1716543 RepID=UPI0013D1E84E|nr:ion channel [Clostridium thermarum]